MILQWHTLACAVTANGACLLLTVVLLQWYIYFLAYSICYSTHIGGCTFKKEWLGSGLIFKGGPIIETLQSLTPKHPQGDYQYCIQNW